jgi:ParB family chromosome partitioning protein
MADIRKKLATKQSKLAAPQPPTHFDRQSVKEQSDSIKQKGVLQPVIIRKDPAGKVILVAGERRFKAAKLAGLEKIPAVMTKGNPLEISIIENLQRENLTPIEEAEALNRMIEEHSYTPDKLAFVIGKAKSTVSETISLNRLPDEIKNQVRRAEQYPRRLLIEIAKQENKKAMLDLFKRVKDGGLKSEEVRNISRKRPPRPQRTPAALALDKALALTNHLSKLDLQTIEQGEKTQLIMQLDNLKKAIEKLLA